MRFTDIEYLFIFFSKRIPLNNKQDNIRILNMVEGFPDPRTFNDIFGTKDSGSINNIQ